MDSQTVLFRDESYAIQGAIFDVYCEMGCGYLEAVYQECLANEFRRRSIPFAAQPELALRYKGDVLIQTYKPDFICYDRIIVEIKAVRELGPEHAAQVINYLKATGLTLALLVSFASYPKVTIRRFVRS
jgi:GxxExxY protein